MVMFQSDKQAPHHAMTLGVRRKYRCHSLGLSQGVSSYFLLLELPGVLKENHIKFRRQKKPESRLNRVMPHCRLSLKTLPCLSLAVGAQ